MEPVVRDRKRGPDENVRVKWFVYMETYTFPMTGAQTPTGLTRRRKSIRSMKTILGTCEPSSTAGEIPANLSGRTVLQRGHAVPSSLMYSMMSNAKGGRVLISADYSWSAASESPRTGSSPVFQGCA